MYHADSVALDVESETESLQTLWNQLLLNTGDQSYKDSPDLIALVEQLMEQGILVSDPNELSIATIEQFHQWFIGMESDLDKDKRCLLEGQILESWITAIDAKTVSHVTVFDALTMFNQYAVYCQINIDGTAITLSQSEQNAVQYDPKSHSAIAMLYRKKSGWKFKKMSLLIMKMRICI